MPRPRTPSPCSSHPSHLSLFSRPLCLRPGNTFILSRCDAACSRPGAPSLGQSGLILHLTATNLPSFTHSSNTLGRLFPARPWADLSVCCRALLRERHKQMDNHNLDIEAMEARAGAQGAGVQGRGRHLCWCQEKRKKRGSRERRKDRTAPPTHTFLLLTAPGPPLQVSL